MNAKPESSALFTIDSRPRWWISHTPATRSEPWISFFRSPAGCTTDPWTISAFGEGLLTGGQEENLSLTWK